MAKSWSEFYADYDGIKSFWKLLDFDQNNPVLKFDTFLAIISTCLDNNVPKFGVHDSFLTLNKMSEKYFEISKILQNLGIKSESRQSTGMTHTLWVALGTVPIGAKLKISSQNLWYSNSCSTNKTQIESDLAQPAHHSIKRSSNNV